LGKNSVLEGEISLRIILSF